MTICLYFFFDCSYHNDKRERQRCFILLQLVIFIIVNMDTPVDNLSSSLNSSYSYNTPYYFTTSGVIIITLYAIIFLFSISGNTLVILTLIQNRRMRTVTNFLLVNLSIGDLLLAVFCMPFTLIPSVLRNFIFGEFMCVAIRYLQGK